MPVQLALAKVAALEPRGAETDKELNASYELANEAGRPMMTLGKPVEPVP